MENKELNIEHISTRIHITQCMVCNNCPLKLFADEKDTILLGVGNIHSNIMVVLPPYDATAKLGYTTLLNLTIDAYKKITGQNLLEDCYVTRYIKCHNKSQFDTLEPSWQECKSVLLYEINRLYPKKVIFFDKAWHERIGLAGDTVMNPGVLYYTNQELIDRFMKEFKEALNYG